MTLPLALRVAVEWLHIVVGIAWVGAHHFRLRRGGGGGGGFVDGKVHGGGLIGVGTWRGLVGGVGPL